MKTRQLGVFVRKGARMSEPYYDPHVTAEMLAAETGGIRWFRHYRPYLYLREGLMAGDLWSDTDPLRTFGGCEILGVAVIRGGYRPAKPMRRCWFLQHGHGAGDYIDGISLPPAPDVYGGVIVKVHPRDSTVIHGQRSPLGYTEREVTPDEIAEAVKYRDAALATWRADVIENERRKQVRREWNERKQAEARAAYAKYKAAIADVERQGGDVAAAASAAATCARDRLASGSAGGAEPRQSELD